MVGISKHVPIYSLKANKLMKVELLLILHVREDASRIEIFKINKQQI